MSLRGLLRGFGLKVGATTPSRFAGPIRDLVEGNATLEVIAAALLAVHETLRRELAGFVEAGAFDRTFGRTGAAVDVDAGRRRDCGAHLCCGDR